MRDGKQTESKKKKRNSKNLENQIADLEDQLKRALADYRNLERRVTEERLNTVRYANEELLKKLLPSFDNLYLAEKYTEDEGIRLTVQKLTENLKELGVEKIEAEGKEFNPESMECVEVVEEDHSKGTGQENLVIEQLSPGYKLFDKVIRPSQVKVGKADSIK